MAEESLEMLIAWLKKEGGNIGIMGELRCVSSADIRCHQQHKRATVRHSRRTPLTYRERIRARVAKEPGLQLIFLESVCDDPDIIATNIALKASSGDPDYAGMSREEAMADFRKRIEAYERVYQTVTESNISFCRISNVGSQVTINRIESYLQSRIAFFLMNLHLKPRSIYLSRVSTEYNPH